MVTAFKMHSSTGMQLLHHILAVSMAESADEDIVQTNVTGFIYV